MIRERVRRALTLRRERFPADEPVLDIGCGATKRGTIGLDIAPGPSVDVQGDATRLPFADNSVSGVVCYHVVEHLDTRAFGALLRESHRVLDPAGRLYLLVDRDESRGALLEKDPTHVERYAPQYVRFRLLDSFDIELFQTHNVLGNVHNHPLRWPSLLGKATKVYVEATPR